MDVIGLQEKSLPVAPAPVDPWRGPGVTFGFMNRAAAGPGRKPGKTMP